MGEVKKISLDCPYPCGKSLVLKLKSDLKDKTKQVMCPYCNNEFYLSFEDGELNEIKKKDEAYFHTKSIVKT